MQDIGQAGWVSTGWGWLGGGEQSGRSGVLCFCLWLVALLHFCLDYSTPQGVYVTAPHEVCTLQVLGFASAG
jgi:hypothetical protein